MKIIPINFVLIIVVVLTIFALSFLYFSLRKKQKRVDEIPQSSHVQVKNNSIPDKKVNLQPVSIPRLQKPIHIKKEKKIEPLNKIESDIKKIKYDKISKDNKKKLIRNSRFEVLNSISGNNDDRNIKAGINKDETSNLKSLGGNILDNYSDEEKNDMFTLKVKDQNNKSKNEH